MSDINEESEICPICGESLVFNIPCNCKDYLAKWVNFRKDPDNILTKNADNYSSSNNSSKNIIIRSTNNSKNIHKSNHNFKHAFISNNKDYSNSNFRNTNFRINNYNVVEYNILKEGYLILKELYLKIDNKESFNRSKYYDRMYELLKFNKYLVKEFSKKESIDKCINDNVKRSNKEIEKLGIYFNKSL